MIHIEQAVWGNIIVQPWKGHVVVVLLWISERIVRFIVDMVLWSLLSCELPVLRRHAIYIAKTAILISWYSYLTSPFINFVLFSLGRYRVTYLSLNKRHFHKFILRYFLYTFEVLRSKNIETGLPLVKNALKYIILVGTIRYAGNW